MIDPDGPVVEAYNALRMVLNDSRPGYWLPRWRQLDTPTAHLWAQALRAVEAACLTDYECPTCQENVDEREEAEGRIETAELALAALDLSDPDLEERIEEIRKEMNGSE